MFWIRPPEINTDMMVVEINNLPPTLTWSSPPSLGVVREHGGYDEAEKENVSHAAPPEERERVSVEVQLKIKVSYLHMLILLHRTFWRKVHRVVCIMIIL